MAKNITIDDLAQMMKKGFDELDGKILQLPTKSYMDDKFANLEGDLIAKLR